MKSQAVAEARVCSKSLARRRLRPSPAKVRSTTQPRGRTSKPLGGIGTLDDFARPPAQPGERLLELVAGVAAIGEDVPEPGEAPG